MVTTTTRKARSQAENGKDPVKVFRPGNGVSLGIYEDTVKGKDGKTRTVYSGTIRKAYRNSEGEWNHVRSLYPSDFLMASWAYAKAYEWVLEQYQSEQD